MADRLSAGAGQSHRVSWAGDSATFGAQSGDLADRFSNLSFTAVDALLALAIIILAWLLSRVARRAVIRASAEVAGVSDDLRNLGARIVGYLVQFTGIGIALSVLGVQIQPVLAVVLLIGVVLVLALRGIADNFAAGIVIQTRRPLHLGDQIDGLGYEGVVRELNSRSVVIETPDGRTVHLPNHELLNHPIVNHTVAGRRRLDVEVRIAGSSGDTPEITGLAVEAAGATVGVLADPAPTAVVTASEPERTTVIVRVWHDPPSASTVASAVIQSLAEHLGRSGRHVVVQVPPTARPVTPPPPF